MLYKTIVICGPGRVRGQNQDNFYLNGAYRGEVDDKRDLLGEICINDTGIIAVADGMGGEKHGELASLEAVRCVKEAQTKGCTDMTAVINECNDRVCRLMDLYRERIGTTFVSCVFNGNDAVVTNIGDSRAYIMNNGFLRKISKDHTVIQQMLDMGIIDKEKAKTHKARHQVTQHIGLYPDELVIEPYTTDIQLCRGDILLLCSDGLTDMVEDTMIERILAADGLLADKAKALYKNALFNGGRDNCTVMLAQAVED